MEDDPRKTLESQDKQHFDTIYLEFRSAFDHAHRVSNAVANRIVFQRRWIASTVFARMCLLAKSITILLDEYPRLHSTIDHGGIAILGRGILEHDILIGYVCENGISKAEWQLRKWTFDLLDVVGRIRLHKGIGSAEEYKRAKAAHALFTARLEAQTLFRSLPNEDKAKILSGERLYVRGIRKAARAAGWNTKEWNGVYTYLSSHAHSAPLSFYYYRHHGVDHQSISDYQFGFIAIVLELSCNALKHSSKRIEDIFANDGQDFPTDEEDADEFYSKFPPPAKA